jgi:hypothetical protein
MKQTTIEMLRAHLMAASLCAVCIEFGMAIAHLCGVADQRFQNASFRLAGLLLIAGCVAAVRCIAQLAFDAAEKRHYATREGPRCELVRVSVCCPWLALVVLHLRFTCKPYAFVDR